jgi:hypothetical protein
MIEKNIAKQKNYYKNVAKIKFKWRTEQNKRSAKNIKY